MKRDIVSLGEIRGNLKVLEIAQYKPRKYKVMCLRCGGLFTTDSQGVTVRNTGCPECKAKDRKNEAIAAYGRKCTGKIFGTLKVLGYGGKVRRSHAAKCVCLNCGTISLIPYCRLGVVETCANCARKHLEKGRQETSDLSKGGSSLLGFARTALNKNSTTGYTGVSKTRNGKKFRAYINFQRKQYHLGTYDTPEEAAAAYREAKEKVFGNFKMWYKKNYPDLWERYKDTINKKREK